MRGFTRTGFRIDEGTVLPAALLTVREARSWSPPALGDLTIEALEAVLEENPEFVLVGTGKLLARPFLPVSEVRQGGTLEFVMSSKPKK